MFVHIHFLWFVLFALALFLLAHKRAPYYVWALVLSFFALIFFVPIPMIAIFLVGSLIFAISSLRSVLITPYIFNFIKKRGYFKELSAKENIELNAGDTWIESYFFDGEINWSKLNEIKIPKLKEEETRFLKERVTEACSLVSRSLELNDDVIKYLKNNRFLGISVPSEFSGGNFSSLTLTETIIKLAGRSNSLCLFTMFANGLNLNSLILQFGTKEQKEYYLPKFVSGDEISAIVYSDVFYGKESVAEYATGVTFKGENGKVYVKLSWKKQPVNTFSNLTQIGVVFNLFDPDKLLGSVEEAGVTIAIVATNSDGVVISSGSEFYVYSEGVNVIVSIDSCIGSSAGIGHGQKMIVETSIPFLTILLPAQSLAIGKLITKMCSANANIKKEFNGTIGDLFCIQSSLAKIATTTYMMDSTLKFSIAGLNSGIKSLIVARICKFKFTSLVQEMITSSHELLNFNRNFKGPQNFLSKFYQNFPFNLNSEKSNLYSKSFEIFKLSSLKAHPFFQLEMKAINENNLSSFDKYFFGHLHFSISNFIKMIFMGISRGYLSGVFGNSLEQKAQRKLNWVTTTFAFYSNLLVINYIFKSKMREQLATRLSEILSWLFMYTASYNNYVNSSKEKEEQLYFSAITNYCMEKFQENFIELIGSFDGFRGKVLRLIVVPFFRLNSFVSPLVYKDEVEASIAKNILTPGFFRDKITDGLYFPIKSDEPLYQLENGMNICFEASKIKRKILKLVSEGRIVFKDWKQVIQTATNEKILTQSEVELLNSSELISNQLFNSDLF